LCAMPCTTRVNAACAERNSKASKHKNPSQSLIQWVSIARIGTGSSPRRLHGAERMHHRVFGRTSHKAIAGNAAQEPLTEHYDYGYDEQGDHCLDQAEEVPQMFHVVTHFCSFINPSAQNH
jgi:hypothetical protein